MIWGSWPRAKSQHPARETMPHLMLLCPLVQKPLPWLANNRKCMPKLLVDWGYVSGFVSCDLVSTHVRLLTYGFARCCRKAPSTGLRLKEAFVKVEAVLRELNAVD